jgi:predicted transcriptional regulator
MPTLDEQLDKLTARITSLESVLAHFVQNAPGKAWYTTAEVARLLDRAEWTVREWCRNGRVHATKRAGGRGKHKEWSISHAELIRITNEGLLPAA